MSTVEVKEGDESAEALIALRFKGGPMSTLTFSDEVAEGTLRDMIAGKLEGRHCGWQGEIQHSGRIVRH